ncbi:MAG: metal-dependent hydrolase [Myxococcota bacterium]|nr:metal-dependent hydrolase [Myxococcota bacterium]
MDTATQALLGAVVGQAGFSHKLGRRALVFGAVGGLLPDLDVLVMASQGPFAEFVYHRGSTHALWFGPVVGPLLGWGIWNFYRWRGREGPGEPGAPAMRSTWMGLMTLALFTHPLIDIFTCYGTQLFAPFSRQRFALDAVGIIDIAYSGVLLVGLAAGCLLRRRQGLARAVAFGALALSWSYMGYATWLNERAEADIARALAEAGQPAQAVRSYPTLLQPYLRRFVARADGEVWVGIHTPLGGGATRWDRFQDADAHPLVERLKQTPRGRIFEWFAMEETTARVAPSEGGTTVEIDDLRYGLPVDPRRGMWGIRALFDSSGRLVGPVVRTRHTGGSTDDFETLWRGMWGEFSQPRARGT